MKIRLSISAIAVVFVSFSFVATADDVIRDPIVDFGKAIEFGIWRVYNDGTQIYVVDQEDGRFLNLESTTNIPVFDAETQRLLLHDNGTSSTLNLLDPDHPSVQPARDALSVALSGHLQDGTYGFGSRRFQVDGETMTVFLDDDLGASGVAIPRTVLKKYSNGLVHEGSSTTTNIDPSVVLDANDIPGPAVTVGDCLATYSPATGRVHVPCISIEGDNTVYRVEQRKVPDTWTFETDLSTFSRVQ